MSPAALPGSWGAPPSGPCPVRLSVGTTALPPSQGRPHAWSHSGGSRTSAGGRPGAGAPAGSRGGALRPPGRASPSAQVPLGPAGRPPVPARVPAMPAGGRAETKPAPPSGRGGQVRSGAAIGDNQGCGLGGCVVWEARARPAPCTPGPCRAPLLGRRDLRGPSCRWDGDSGELTAPRGAPAAGGLWGTPLPSPNPAPEPPSQPSLRGSSRGRGARLG